MRSAIVARALDPAALLREVANLGSGASALFVGTVRDVHQGRAVTGMDYEAYAAMAERELASIVAEAAVQFGTEHVVCEHRVGRSTWARRAWRSPWRTRIARQPSTPAAS